MQRQASMNTTKEIKSLTGLRGIAAFWIVLHHYFGRRPMETDGFAVKTLLNFNSNGYLAVDFFFILSSFVLFFSYHKTFENTVSAADYKRFMKKRFVRIYPLLTVTVLFSFLFLYPGNWDLFVFYISLTFIFLSEQYRAMDSLDITWSLACEFIMYFVFPFFILFFTKNQKWIRYTIPVSVLLFCAVYLFPTITFSQKGLVLGNIHSSGGFLNTPFGTSAVIRCFAGYLLGIFSYHLYRSEKKFNLIILVVLLVVMLFFKKLDILVLVLIALLLPSVIANPQSFLSKILSSKPVYFLGLISYSIYLVHIVPLTLLYFNENFLTQYLPLFAYKIICIVLTLIISTITYQLIEVKASKMLRLYFRL